MNTTIKKATLIGLKRMMETNLSELDEFTSSMPNYDVDAYFIKQAIKVSDDLCEKTNQIANLVIQIKETYEE